MSDSGQDHEYVPRAAEEAWTGPSGFRDVTLHGFVVEGDGALARRHAETLHRPAVAGAWACASRSTSPIDRVLLLFVDSERFQIPCRQSGDEGVRKDRMTEQLFAIVMFGDADTPESRPVAFAPYVYASLPPGWRTEREIFGYPQQLANIRIGPRRGRPADLLHVSARAIRRFSPDAIRETPTTILRIERKRGADETEVVRTNSRSAFLRHCMDRTSAGHSATETRQIRSSSFSRGIAKPRFGVTDADIAFLGTRARRRPTARPCGTRLRRS